MNRRRSLVPARLWVRGNQGAYLIEIALGDPAAAVLEHDIHGVLDYPSAPWNVSLIRYSNCDAPQ